MIVIPKGKKVEFWLNDTKLLPDRNIVLEDDINIALQSSFSSLVNESGSTALSLVGGVTRDLFNFGFSGQFKELGFQLWKSTDQ